MVRNVVFLLKEKSIIIEPTSGNIGIALTGIANLLEYKVEILPEKASNETKEIIRNLGAKVFETTDDLCPKVGAGTDQSIALVTSIASFRPDTYYSPNFMPNFANFSLFSLADFFRSSEFSLMDSFQYTRIKSLDV